MKTLSASGLAVLLVCWSANLAVAGDYKSVVLGTGASLTSPIDVPDDRFLVIRNFTQNGGTNRGFVTVTIGSSAAVTVLTASIVPPDSSSTLEAVNTMVIAGPATVNVTCGSDATTCFVSYRKEGD